MTNKQIPSCKRFSGYKPCFTDYDCWTNGCKDNVPIGKKILIINLDAMGDVLMTTAQLPALKKKFPESTIYWVTLKIAAPLLYNNQFIDKVYSFDAESILVLEQIEFDIILNVDKSQRSCALLNKLSAEKKFGFGLDNDGKIIPMNERAFYNYQLGMDDHLKFKVNIKTGQQYLAETFELDFKNDEYVFAFTDDEELFIERTRKKYKLKKSDKVIGFNTGCSELYPNKKMTVEQHIYLIDNLLKKRKYKILLLGGPEDQKRNEIIYSHFKSKIINTPTNEGVRRGACYEALADVIITGDSFGMHLGIALKKFIIVWFGVSCWNEIELYNRGVKLFQDNLFCSPCWKKNCPYNLECIKQIDLKRIVSETENYFLKKDV